MSDEPDRAIAPSRLEPLMQALAEARHISLQGYSHAICEHGVLIERNGHAFGIVVVLEHGYQFVMADRSESAEAVMSAGAIARQIEKLVLLRAGQARREP